ncbi:hypothetical protein ABPG72_000561 [Tetrahymena utriculariae]
MNKLQVLLIAAIACTIGSTLYLLNKSSSDVQESALTFPYDENLAESLAGFSMASYCKASKIQNWSCGTPCSKNPQGIQDVYIMKNKTMNSVGYLAYSPANDAIVVVFRGTVPWLIKNWISDINTVKTKYPRCQKCYVHLGFFNAFKELQDQILTEFPKLKAKYPTSKVFVTGHSLGAAISTHAVPVIYELNGNKPIDAFYNFGSPRVGDENYHQWFDSQNFTLQYGRVNHRADPVPHLPPNYSPFIFTHIDHEVFYSTFKKPYKQCIETESLECADGIKIPLDIADHLSYFGWDWATNILACQ